MKTDKFEDSIRKKLNQINPEFQETDWDNFKAFSKAYKTPFLKTLLGKSIAFTAAAITTSVIIIFNISQYNENKALNQKNIELSKVNEQLLLNQKDFPNTKLNDNKNNNNKLFKKDINGGNDVSINDVSENSIVENSEQSALNTTSNSLSENIIVENNKIKLENKVKVNSNDIKRINKNSLNFTEKINTYIKKDKLFGLKNSVIKKYKNKKELYVSDTKNNHLENTNTLNEQNGLLENTSQIVLEIKYISNKGIVIDSTNKIQKQLAAKDFAYYMPKDEINLTNKKGFSLNDAYLRIGATAEIAKDYKSTSLVGELFLDQRISIATGIKLTNIEGDNFKSESDFKVKRSRNFQELYKTKNIPEAHIIANMKEQSKLLQLPIYINYHHPLKNNLWLLAGIGTDLDLKVESQSEYSFKLLKPFGPITQYGMVDERQKAKANTITRKTLNNLNLNIGAEKRFGKLTAQITAYNTSQVKKVDYRKNNTTFGGAIRLFYSL